MNNMRLPLNAGRNRRAAQERLARILASRKEPFSNTTGLFTGRPVGDKGYEIYSYGTLIAYYSETDGWFINSERYSVTTTKQQGILRYILRDEGYREY